MAGTIKTLHQVTLTDADVTAALPAGGAHQKAAFYAVVTAITRTTGTLTITLRWKHADGVVTMAATAALTATGAARFVLTAGVWDITNSPIPEPGEVFWDLAGDTAQVSGKIIAIYGD